MRSSDIVLILGALASGALACAARSTGEATEIPAVPSRDGGESSCKHELGRCGGHKPGDGACGSAAPDTADAGSATPTPLEDVVLAAGGFAEIDLEMAAGAATEVTFQATGALAWNVHSHDGDAVEIHAEGTGATGKLRFAAPSAGLYSYMWKNTGDATVRLTAHLAAQGTVRVRSIHPAPGGT